jgi:SAM-dependent methyltransferase
MVSATTASALDRLGPDMFSASAELYDLLYSTFKDYAGEAARIASLLRLSNPQYQTVFDVACGTGEHARLLAGHGFAVDGIVLDPAFVRIASVVRLTVRYTGDLSKNRVRVFGPDEGFR